MEMDGAQMLSQALQNLRKAIELLDRARAPAQIAAHVDFAAHQLQDAIEAGVAGARLNQIDRNAEPQ